MVGEHAFPLTNMLAGRLTLHYSKAVHLTESFLKSLLSITDEKMHMHPFELEFSFIISRYDVYAIELDGSSDCQHSVHIHVYDPCGSFIK